MHITMHYSKEFRNFHYSPSNLCPITWCSPEVIYFTGFHVRRRITRSKFLFPTTLYCILHEYSVWFDKRRLKGIIVCQVDVRDLTRALWQIYLMKFGQPFLAVCKAKLQSKNNDSLLPAIRMSREIQWE